VAVWFKQKQEVGMSGQIASGSRISDLVHLLSDPIEYVSGVLSNFVLYGYNPETSAIRVGRTGAGVFPNYKVEEASVPVTITVGSRQFKMTRIPARTFSGRNHREMTELDDLERHDENWSKHTITYAELKALLSYLSESKIKH
jgi:hypothetical protein